MTLISHDVTLSNSKKQHKSLTEVCVGTIAGKCGSNTSSSDFGVAPVATGKFEETQSDPKKNMSRGVFQGDGCKTLFNRSAKLEVVKSSSKSVLAGFFVSYFCQLMVSWWFGIS